MLRYNKQKYSMLFTENNTVGFESYLSRINMLCGQDTGRRALNQIITCYINCRALTGQPKST